jgi:hypothetical protein
MKVGRANAWKHGPRTNIEWALDCQGLTLSTTSNKAYISLHHFRSMVWVAIQDAQLALRQLMFGWDPNVNLGAVQDSLVNNQVGWSFLSEPANELQHSFWYLQQQAWQNSDSGLMAKDCWVPSRVSKYLSQVTAFQHLLYFASTLQGACLAGLLKLLQLGGAILELRCGTSLYSTGAC